mgnify:CR=1 FL=1
MRNKIFILILFVVLLTGCSTSNEIVNKTYDVDVEINDISEAFIPAAEKGVQSSIGVSGYVRSNIFGTWELKSVGSGVVYYGKAVLNDGTTIDDITETKERSDVNYYLYRAITNYHVVNAASRDVMTKVYLSKIDLLVDAVVLGKNIYEDLAVVEFQTSIYIPIISFGDSDKVKTGEIVLAVGNPEGYKYADSVSLGIISNAKRYVDVDRDLNNDGRNDWSGACEYLQHDASINSGNSGGALINIKGELIGINTMKLVDTSNTIEGMGFAIPIEEATTYADKIVNGEDVSRPFLGIQMYEASMDYYAKQYGVDPMPGVLIGAVTDNSPASKAGLRVGDVITRIGNKDVTGVASLRYELYKYSAGDVISITYVRNGQTNSAKLTLATQ